MKFKTIFPYLLCVVLLFLLFHYLTSSVAEKEQGIIYVPDTDNVYSLQFRQMEELNVWQYLNPFRHKFYKEANNIDYLGKYAELIKEAELKENDLNKYIESKLGDAVKFDPDNLKIFEILYWNNDGKINLPDDLQIIADDYPENKPYHLSSINFFLVTYTSDYKVESHGIIKNAIMLRGYMAERAMIILDVHPAGSRIEFEWYRNKKSK